MGNETNSLRSDALVSDPFSVLHKRQRPKRGHVNVKSNANGNCNCNCNFKASARTNHWLIC